MLDNPIVIASLIVGLLGALLLFAGLARLRRGRLLGALGRIGSGSLLLALGLLAGSIAFNLYSYHRFTHEQEVATLRFRQLGPQRYLADLSTPGGAAQRYELRGDEWQLDARVLKWRGG